MMSDRMSLWLWRAVLALFVVLTTLSGASAQQAQSNFTAVPCNTTAAGVAINTITTGGTAQTLIVGAHGINGFQIQNIDTTEPLWISWQGTASPGAAGSYAIPAATATTFASAGSYYSAIGFTNNISIYGATTGHKFACDRW